MKTKKLRLRRWVKDLFIYLIGGLVVAGLGLATLKLWSIRDAEIRCTYNSNYCR